MMILNLNYQENHYTKLRKELKMKKQFQNNNERLVMKKVTVEKNLFEIGDGVLSIQQEVEERTKTHVVVSIIFREEQNQNSIKKTWRFYFEIIRNLKL
ncbi:unnamed protein product [Paramecium primaurelia]|uniref:Uncharacterized protein n=1 Tax=Paramecium primaurelia TaxID=5886 RepID=A0A8S1KSV4_PARPR|nr:unnamed protein product [Paramecium primaurelia]